MRAPWNQNANPYVTRYNTTYGFDFTAVPNCQTHKDILSKNTFTEFGSMVAYASHGTTHMMIGGIGNADYKNVLKSLNYSLNDAQTWVPTAFAYQKNMFRKGWLSCPKTCSLDTPMTECKCVCSNITYWSTMNETELWDAVLYRIMATKWKNVVNREGSGIGYQLLELFCNVPKNMAPTMGDSLESASPSDVSFWPTHPTVERLWHWRRLNGLASSVWTDNQAWSVKGFLTEYCFGHNFDDTLTWPDHLWSEKGPYTNRDL